MIHKGNNRHFSILLCTVLLFGLTAMTALAHGGRGGHHSGHGGCGSYSQEYACGQAYGQYCTVDDCMHQIGAHSESCTYAETLVCSSNCIADTVPADCPANTDGVRLHRRKHCR